MYFDVPALIVLIVVCALAFDFINGFHDTANAIATVVSTRVLSPRMAILLATLLNFFGALFATGVAKTVASGLIDVQYASQSVVLGAIVGAIVWNLITWYYGIPSSSSHALMGGLCGAALAHAGWHSIVWNDVNAKGDRIGVLYKVLVPIVVSPLGAFLIGWAVMTIIYNVFAKVHPGRVGKYFRFMQMFSAAAMAGMHGSNDAQKSMGIVTMALWTLPATSVLRPAKDAHGMPTIPTLVILACALAMAAGTSVGGWRIIKTMGQKIIRLEPVHGFAAETSAATVIFIADLFHAPISTTHAISGSIFGVGAAKRLSAVRWTVAQNMAVAWVLTLPASGAVAAITYLVLRWIGIND